MNNYFLTRATCRNFSDKEISDSKIKEMLEAAAHAPTTGNMQLYSVIVTRDKSRKELMAPAHFSQPAYMKAPVLLTFCADFNRFNKWCEQNRATPGYDNLQSFIAAALDTTILAQQFVTIAEMEGFGTCYLGTTTYNPDKIAQALELPPFVVPITTIALGYPLQETTKTDRISLSGWLHNETYKQYAPEDINNIFDYKEKIAENQQFIKENNKTTLAQVFTDVRYPKSNNEHFSRVFRDFLIRQGFLDKPED